MSIPEKGPTVLLKVGKHFIDQNNIRAVTRKGKNTVISLFKGADIVVSVDYDKIMQMLPPGR